MEDKLAKVRADIERLIEQTKPYLGACAGQVVTEANSKIAAYNDVLYILDSMQKEPKECMYSKDNYTDKDRKVLCDGCEEECKFNKKEDPVSGDLEQAIDTYLATYFGGEKEKQDWPFLKKMAIYFANWREQQDKKWLADNHKRTFNNGYEEGFEAGRDDMEEQMMKDAIETSVCAMLDGIHIDILPKQLKGYRFGDKVKVLIIKCD